MSDPIRIAEDVWVWTDEGGSIHIKTTDPHGDPVELNEAQAEELIMLLQAMVARVK